MFCPRVCIECAYRWACDMGRGCGRPAPTCNVVVEVGNWPYKGFTVADINEFLSVIKSVVGQQVQVKEGFPF